MPLVMDDPWQGRYKTNYTQIHISIRFFSCSLSLLSAVSCEQWHPAASLFRSVALFPLYSPLSTSFVALASMYHSFWQRLKERKTDCLASLYTIWRWNPKPGFGVTSLHEYVIHKGGGVVTELQSEITQQQPLAWLKHFVCVWILSF